MLLRPIDVVHDFYVPEFRAKMDLLPGVLTRCWFTPTRTGTFDILCAGFCGVGHAQMRGSIVIGDENAYRAWLGKQAAFGRQGSTSMQARRGKLRGAGAAKGREER